MWKIVKVCSNTTSKLEKQNPIISSNIFTQSAAKERSISLDLRVAVQYKFKSGSKFGPSA